MALYRILISLVALWEAARLVWRRDRAALRDRFGMTEPPEGGHHIWLHAASNGELASARPVLMRLLRTRPDLAVLITCNTPSGVALAQSWEAPRVAAHLAPLDLRWTARRMMRRWHVAAHISMEAELWPNRIAACPGPVILLGARLTERTAKGWRRAPRLARTLLERVDLALPQDAGSGQRLVALGLPPQHLGPVVDLKALYDPPDMAPDATLRETFARPHTWLAASTHPGDDEVVLDAHLVARQTEPDLRLILAPRHPRRADDIIRLIEARGLTLAQRSLGAPARGADIYLADTMGEMALWYALAGRVFIAGTLSDRGGHTPYEPAAFGAALIHGPDVGNFASAFARLQADEAALEVTEAQSLARALTSLARPDRQSDMARAAQATLRPDTDLDAVLALVEACLPPPDPISVLKS